MIVLGPNLAYLFLWSPKQRAIYISSTVRVLCPKVPFSDSLTEHYISFSVIIYLSSSKEVHHFFISTVTTGPVQSLDLATYLKKYMHGYLNLPKIASFTYQL